MFCSKFVYKEKSNNNDDFIDQANTFLSFILWDSWTGGACNYTKKSNTCNKTFSINMRDYFWYVPPAAIHKATPHSERRKHSYTIFTKTVDEKKLHPCVLFNLRYILWRSWYLAVWKWTILVIKVTPSQKNTSQDLPIPDCQSLTPNVMIWDLNC